MLSKKEVKDIQSLSDKKFRAELKLFVAEGPKIVGELLQLIPDCISRIYAVREWINNNQRLSLQNLVEVSDTELQRLSSLQTAHQVIAVVRQFEHGEPAGSGIILYLDTIQDPGNFGTIIRIADWFNVREIVCSSGCADLYNPKVVQSSMASIARVLVYYDESGDWIAQQRSPKYAASLDGTSLYELPKIDKGILVIGNESKGIRPEILSLVTKRITIPRKGAAESLNAAVATGIILSHLLN